MTHHAIIGHDEVNKNGFIIEYRKGELQIHNETIKFQGESLKT